MRWQCDAGAVSVPPDLRLREIFRGEPRLHLLLIRAKGEWHRVAWHAIHTELPRGRLAFISRDDHQQLAVHLIHHCSTENGTAVDIRTT